MKYLSAIVLFNLAIMASAQPVLTELNSAPQIGQSFVINSAAFQEPPAGGADQAWDFSGLVATGTTTLQFVDPATTPNAAEFTSEVAETAAGSPETRYFESESFGLFLDGFAHTNGFFMAYDGSGSPIMQRPYPCTFQDTWNDDYGGSTFFQGVQFFFDGDYNGEADGYGTLEMPWGTVADVLRIHMVINETQAIIGAQSDYIQDYYEYYAPGISYPLIRTYDRVQVINGGGIVQMEQTLVWLSEITLGAAEIPVATAFTLIPNPAHDAVSVNITSADASRIDLVDASGRTVRSEQLVRGASLKYRLDLEDVVPGLYSVRVNGTNGITHTQRLVVE